MRRSLLVLSMMLTVVSLAAGSALGADFDTYSSRAAFDADPVGQPRQVENFDGFADDTCLDDSDSGECDSIDGITFSSPLADEPVPYLPIRAHASDAATSSPNILTGGLNASSDEQVIEIEFDAPVDAVGFDVIDFDSFVTIEAEFGDGDEECFELCDEGCDSFFGITSEDGIASLRLSEYGCDTPGASPDRSRRPERSAPSATEILSMNAAPTSVSPSGESDDNFGIDDLTFSSSLPCLICERIVIENGGATSIDGVAELCDDNEGGIDSIVLQGGAENVSLNTGGFTPGDSSASFNVGLVNPTQDGNGIVEVTAGEDTCTMPVNFCPVPEGELLDKTLCTGEGIKFTASNDFVEPAAVAACSQELCDLGEPEFPVTYECPQADPPCKMVIIDSSIAGDTDVVYVKDGPFVPDMRILCSRMEDGDWSPFEDVTTFVQHIINIDPDPTRSGGTPRWSLVRCTCAVTGEPDCEGDPELLGLDEDEDGFPLCDVNGNPVDCADQLADVFPGQNEICNGLDDDCDGDFDEGFHSDGDDFPDCFDNCPLIDNPDQADADMDGIGDVCDETYLSVSAPAVVPPIVSPGDILRNPTGSTAIEIFENGFLYGGLNVDAVDLDATGFLFSVSGPGYATGSNGFMIVNEFDIYHFNTTTDAVTTELRWIDHALAIGSVDALDRLGDGSYVFSTRTAQVLGADILSPGNLYRFDPGTGAVELYVDLAPFNVTQVDGVDVLNGDRVAFSTQLGILTTLLGSQIVQDGEAWIVDAERKRLTLAFDGPAHGVFTLDALSLGILSGEFVPPGAPDVLCDAPEDETAPASWSDQNRGASSRGMQRR